MGFTSRPGRRTSIRGSAASVGRAKIQRGQPFFARELLRGVSLTEYADGQRLDPAARLGLLAQVCDAVQHAHEQGRVQQRPQKPEYRSLVSDLQLFQRERPHELTEPIDVLDQLQH